LSRDNSSSAAAALCLTQQQQQQEGVVCVGLEVCEVCEQQQSEDEQQQQDWQQQQQGLGQGTAAAAAAAGDDVEGLQQRLVQLRLSVLQQQQQQQQGCDEGAVQSAAEQVGDQQAHSAGPAVNADPAAAAAGMDAAAVSAAAAIAAAALAASPEDLLSELPGAEAGCVCCDDGVQQPPEPYEQPAEPYEVQEEPEPYSPEPPSPGSYVPLDASEGADSAGDECSSREQMLQGENAAGGFSNGMSGVLGFGEGGEGSGQGSMPDDFVEKLVRRVSGGALPAGLDLNLGLDLDLSDRSAAAAAAAATCVSCASLVAVPPVLVDLGISIPGLAGIPAAPAAAAAAAGDIPLRSDLGVGGLGLRHHVAGSPVTAIEELGNASCSSDSRHSTCGSSSSSSQEDCRGPGSDDIGSAADCTAGEEGVVIGQISDAESAGNSSSGSNAAGVAAAAAAAAGTAGDVHVVQ
jgi:hypothetical protein